MLLYSFQAWLLGNANCKTFTADKINKPVLKMKLELES